MKRTKQVGLIAWTAAGATAALLYAGGAQAFVLEAKTDAQKHRRDVGKQLAKYIFCLGKTGLKCEKKGSHTGSECDLTDGSTEATIDAKTAGKFVADIAKCDGKFVPAKKQKTSNYQQIGCPGDCDANTDGIQQCADLNTYRANVLDGANAAGAKAQISLLGTVISANCVAHVGLPPGNSTDEEAIKCAANDAKRLSTYAKGVNKCIELCENDYKNKKGDGGATDASVCNPATASGAFADCLTKKADKQLTKVVAAANAGLVATIIDAALHDAADDLFNKDDPTTNPDVNVCGTCGDNVREGSEACDGSDDALCVGVCNSDCTCP